MMYAFDEFSFQPRGDSRMSTSTPVRAPRTAVADITNRLDEQQVELEEMKLRQAHLEHQLTSQKQENDTLRSQVRTLVEQQSGGCSRKQKQRLPRELTKRVCSVYQSLEDDLEFDLSKSITDSTNNEIRENIFRILKTKNDEDGSKYAEKTMKASITALYNALRRQFREDQPQHTERVEKQSRSRRRRSRQRRVFIRRKHKLQVNEVQYWRSVDVAHMTEEDTDDEVAGGLVCHRITWRSDDYNDFMRKLDSRVGQPTTPRLHRREGSPSQKPPPSGLPGWMLRPAANTEEWEED